MTPPERNGAAGVLHGELVDYVRGGESARSAISALRAVLAEADMPADTGQQGAARAHPVVVDLLALPVLNPDEITVLVRILRNISDAGRRMVVLTADPKLTYVLEVVDLRHVSVRPFSVSDAAGRREVDHGQSVGSPRGEAAGHVGRAREAEPLQDRSGKT